MHVLADPNGATSAAIVIAWTLVSFIAYFTPAIVALARKVPNAGSVVVVDLLLGWTIVGWIVALAMACRSKPPTWSDYKADLRWDEGRQGFVHDPGPWQPRP